MKTSDKNQFKIAAYILKSVGHPDRLAILDLLINQDKCTVSFIQKKINITQSMTSQHLAALRKTGILGCEKKGNNCIYFIQNKNILQLLSCIKKSSKNVVLY